MSAWERRSFKVMDDLRLDPNNVRLDPSIRGKAPEGDIIQELFQSENAFDLARSIAINGFFTHETPTVVRRKNQWIVVEGNRRAAAVKGLLNPYLVPGFQSRLSKLVDEHPLPDSVEEIECLIAPSQDEADQLIATLHTSNPRKAWGPLRQAEFFADRLGAGKSVDQLIADYPEINVAEFVRTSEMYRLLQSAEYEDDDLAAFVQRRNFPISTFDRLYANPEFLALAKLSVDDRTGRVTLSGDKGDFDALATKIVGDIKKKRINTRTLNKPGDDSYKEYMTELQPLTVRASGDDQPVAELPAPAPDPKPKPKVSPTLDVSGLFPPKAFPAIGTILDELSRLRYVDFPNATFDLMRTFIEKSIKAYADGLGQTIPSKGAYVYLDSALAWLDEDVKAAGNKKKLVQVIARLRNNQKMNVYAYGLSGDLLNAANHNHEIAVEKSEVLAAWDGIINLMRYVLREERA